MNRIILCIVLIVALMSVGSLALAQDEQPTDVPVTEIVEVVATEVPTAVVEQTPIVEPTPVVIVDNPSEDRLTWRELGLYALVGVVVISISVIAYRLVTMVGASYPPGTSIALERGWQRADEFSKSSPNVLDDLAYYLADPLVQNAIKAVKDREANRADPGDGAVG